MKVLIMGSGAREHALAWKISQSPRATHVWCAPGNAGTAAFATHLDMDFHRHDDVVAAAKRLAVDLVVIGPEAPLVSGLADELRRHGFAVFGPGRQAAQLEGSKAFSKLFMKRHGIPTAAFEVFEDAHRAEAFLRAHPGPWVVKADGLAAGKGVTVAADTDEAVRAVDAMMRQRVFGDAGARVVIEQTLVGQEISYHVVSDGSRYVALAAAQDHKRLLDGDQGPNTGGMGAYSPPPFMTEELETKIHTRVVDPTLAGLQSEGISFQGALFLGLMIVQGEPYLLEYNVRFGDPETEVMMARYQGDVLTLLLDAARGNLPQGLTPSWAGAAACVVIAAHGYPSQVRVGDVIDGLADAAAVDGVQCFHAGTAVRNGQVVTSGGRVLALTASADTVSAALDRVYHAASRIRLDGMQYRRDIGWQATRTILQSPRQS
jgi:phosphoribosylamine--glycine ligase